MRKLFTIIVLAICLILPFTVEAITTYNANALTGGTQRDLDYLSVSEIDNGDRAVVVTGTLFYFFKYDSTATDAENTTSHPFKVRPDDYATAGVWIEQELAPMTGVDAYGGLAAAVAIWNADGSDVTLEVRTSQTSLSANLTVNSNISLISFKQGLISIDTGKTLTINGPFEAGLYQVFTGAGTVSFGSGAVKEVYAEWWGAVADDSTDNTTALQAALNSHGTTATYGAKLKLLEGTYQTGKLTVYGKWTIKGVSRRGTTLALKDGANESLLDMSDDYCVFVTLRDFSLYGNYSNQTGTSHGIETYRTGIDITMNGFHHIENIEVYEFLTHGIYWIGNVNGSSFHNVFSRHNRQYGFNIAGADNFFVGCITQENQWGSFYITSPNNMFVTCKAFLDGENEDSDVTFFGASQQPAWIFRDTGTDILSGITLTACIAQENYGHGFYFQDAEHIVLAGCVADSNSQGATTTWDGFYFKNSKHIVLQGVACNYLTKDYQRYGINIDANSNNLSINVISQDQQTADILYSLTAGGNNFIVINGETYTIPPVTETITATGNILPYGITYIDSNLGAWIGATLPSTPPEGTIKTVIMTDATTACSLIVTNHEHGDGTTYTFAAVDDTVVLMFTGTEWITLAQSGTLENSTVWDPGNLIDGAGETKGLTCNGAELGDYVLVSAPYDLQDMTVTAYVQAANVVEIRLQNESGGAIDLGSGTWRVKALKAQ